MRSSPHYLPGESITSEHIAPTHDAAARDDSAPQTTWPRNRPLSQQLYSLLFLSHWQVGPDSFHFPSYSIRDFVTSHEPDIYLRDSLSRSSWSSWLLMSATMYSSVLSHLKRNLIEVGTSPYLLPFKILVEIIAFSRRYLFMLVYPWSPGREFSFSRTFLLLPPLQLSLQNDPALWLGCVHQSSPSSCLHTPPSFLSAQKLQHDCWTCRLTQGIQEHIITMNNICITHAFNTLYNSTKDPEVPDLFSSG